MNRLFRKFNLHEGKRGSAITVHVIPGAPEKKLSDILDDGTLILELDTKDVSGKTNQVLIKYLSNILNVLSDEIEVVAGKDGPDKIVSILNQESSVLQNKLFSIVEK